MPADPHGVLDGLGDGVLGGGDGLVEAESGGEARGDGGRVGATGAVGGHTPDERSGEQSFPATVPEDVHGLGRVGEVPALDEEGAAVTAVELAGGRAKVIDGPQGRTEEMGGLVEVGGGDSCERKELGADGVDGVGLQQDGATGGDHHGIDDEGRASVPGPPFDDDLDEVDVPKHARLCGARRQFLEHGLEL